MQNNNVIYFDSFGVEHIPKEIKAFINNKNIKPNTFRIQAYVDFMLEGKTLTEYTNLFSPNNFKKNDDIVSNYFTK